MISVVLALWNSNQWLIGQLDSIRNQTRKVDEVILVDDASENETVQMVCDYLEKYHLSSWKLYQHQKNRGFVETFRDALGLAGGDLIFLCDHDDLWKEDKVEKMVQIMEENPELKVLTSSFTPIDANGKEIPVHDLPGKSNHNLIKRKVEAQKLNWMSYQDLAAYNISPGCTALIRKEIGEQYLKIRSDLPHDWALYILACLENGLGYLDLPLTLYRQHEHNTLGLAHRSLLEQRIQGAAADWLNRKEQLRLLEQLDPQNLHPEEKALARTCEQLFSKRLQTLKEKNLKAIPALLWKSKNIPFLYETLLADSVAIIKDRPGESHD